MPRTGSRLSKSSCCCPVQAHNAKQSVIDAKNRAQDRAWRFWMTARPQNKTQQLLSEGVVPSNTAALRRQPRGEYQPAPQPSYQWRGRTWSDQVGGIAPFGCMSNMPQVSLGFLQRMEGWLLVGLIRLHVRVMGCPGPHPGNLCCPGRLTSSMLPGGIAQAHVHCQVAFLSSFSVMLQHDSQCCCSSVSHQDPGILFVY